MPTVGEPFSRASSAIPLRPHQVALALVSFLAVYREAFEIVLFYQALWLQAAPAYAPMLGGLCVAAVALTDSGG